MSKKEKYLYKSCGCDEFVTQPNKYDIFIAEDGKSLLQESLLMQFDAEDLVL